MDLSDDLPPPRRPLLVPVVIATVLLCLIGVGAGLALSARHRADVRASGHDSDPGAQPADTYTPSAGSRPSARPTGKPCLEQTQQTARAHGIADELTQVLRLQTRTSTVYICQDGRGDLYYHANNTRGGGDWVEGRSALFLTTVVKKGSTYQATAPDGVIFSVTSTRLLIRHKDGSTEVQYPSP